METTAYQFQDSFSKLFYYDLYQTIERAINLSIKDGIDTAWIVKAENEDWPLEIRSRMRYAAPKLLNWAGNVRMITVKILKKDRFPLGANAKTKVQ